MNTTTLNPKTALSRWAKNIERRSVRLTWLVFLTMLPLGALIALIGWIGSWVMMQVVGLGMILATFALCMFVQFTGEALARLLLWAERKITVLPAPRSEKQPKIVAQEA